jgi:tetratricopeptide (TPR) repeat protein
MWKVIVAIYLNLVGAATFVFVAVLLIQALRVRTLAIEPLGVPHQLAGNGYTAEVAAQRLRDALKQFVQESQSLRTAPELMLHGDFPDIVIPSVGISLATLAANIRIFLHRDIQHVSGEFLIENGRLWLRLRLNGRSIYNSPEGKDPQHPDELMVSAASAIYEVAEPYFVAAWLYDKDRTKALGLARKIIAERPPTDANVLWSHQLIGNALTDEGTHDAAKYNEAVDEYRAAIRLNPRLPTFHYNLGYVFDSMGRYSEAIDEYRAAIRLDPNYAAPHNNLALLLAAHDKPDEAIQEYRTTIRLLPEDLRPRQNLILLLATQKKFDEAKIELDLVRKLRERP